MILTTPLEGSSAIFLLIAVQYFNAASQYKAIIAAASSIGLLFAPFILQMVAKLGISVSRAMTGIYFLGAIGCFLIAFSSSLSVFLLGVLGFSIFACATAPLSTAMWQQNSPDHTRGSLFSRLMLWGMLSKVVFGVLFSCWLGSQIDRYWLIPVVFAVLLLMAGYCAFQIPTQAPRAQGRLHPGQQFGLIWKNKTFGALLLSWMLFGFANLALLPLRTEYLASGAEFPAYAPMLVILLIDVIPTAMRLISVMFWGSIFDRFNFLILRAGLNCIFGLSTLLFFVPSLLCQAISCVLHGLAQGGGSLVWNLWVTKYAPAEQTADYMAVHVSLTGLRGILGPAVGFWLLGYCTFMQIALIAMGFTLLSLVPLITIYAREIRKNRDAQD